MLPRTRKTSNTPAATTNVSIIIDTNTTRVPVNYGKKRLYPDKNYLRNAALLDSYNNKQHSMHPFNSRSLVCVVCMDPGSGCSTNTASQGTFINFRKAEWTSFKDGIELQLKKQRPVNVYHAEKTLRKAINAAAGRHIPQGRIKKVVANFPSEAVKLSEKRDEIQRKITGDANNATKP